MPTQTSNPSTCAAMHKVPICLTCLVPLTIDFVQDSILGGGMFLISCAPCGPRYDYIPLNAEDQKNYGSNGHLVVTDQFPPKTTRDWLRHHHARAQQREVIPS